MHEDKVFTFSIFIGSSLLAPTFAPPSEFCPLLKVGPLANVVSPAYFRATPPLNCPSFLFYTVYVFCINAEQFRIHCGRYCFMPKLLNVLAKVSDLCRRTGYLIERCVSPTSSSTEGLETFDDGNYGMRTFDYGPLGVEVKRSIAKEWWQEVVTSRANVHGLDLSLMWPTQNEPNGLEVANCDSSEILNSYLCSETCRHAFNYMESYAFTVPFGLAQNVKILTRGNNDIDQFIFR